jgi:pimeloyl-ACP methyl ester carboxylesterase
VQFVLGDSDAMTWPKAARAMATALKAQVHVVRAGHNLMTEAPEATLAALREALA